MCISCASLPYTVVPFTPYGPSVSLSPLSRFILGCVCAGPAPRLPFCDRLLHGLPHAARRRYPLLDGHNDLPWALHDGYDYQLDKVDLSKDLTGVKVPNLRHGSLHTDIPRARAGGMGAQFWSVFVPFSVQGGDAVHKTLEQIDVVHRLCEKYPDDFEFAPTAADVHRVFGEGKIACLMGAEGGHQINDSLAVLRM